MSMRAFPPMSGQRHIGHTLQKRVSNSPLARSRGGYQCRTCTRRCQPRSTELKRKCTCVRFGVRAVGPGANGSCALIGPSQFHGVKCVTCGTSYWPQIVRFIILLFRQLPTDGIWYLSELDGCVSARPDGPDHWSVSRINHAVASGRTLFRAHQTRGALTLTLGKQEDRR